MLKSQIEDLNHSLHLGLAKLNWTSGRISVFIDSANLEVEKFRAVLFEVRKQSCSIHEIITKLETTTLIDVADFVSSPLKDMVNFCNLVESQAENRLNILVHMYRSIKHFLIKIEMSVSESSGERIILVTIPPFVAQPNFELIYVHFVASSHPCFVLQGDVASC